MTTECRGGREAAPIAKPERADEEQESAERWWSVDKENAWAFVIETIGRVLDEKTAFDLTKEIIRRGLLPDSWSKREREIFEGILPFESEDEVKSYFMQHAEELPPELRECLIDDTLSDIELAEEKEHAEEQAGAIFDAARKDITMLREAIGDKALSKITPTLLQQFLKEKFGHDHPIQAIYFLLHAMEIPVVPDWPIPSE